MVISPFRNSFPPCPLPFPPTYILRNPFTFPLHPNPFPLSLQTTILPSLPLLRRPIQENPQPPISDKGILPLPANLKPISTREGDWIPVVNKKKARKFRSHLLRQRLPTTEKIERCFLCRSPHHMAKEYKIGSFRCFKCKELGHTSRSCPLSYQPHSRPIPIISLPQSVKDNISQLSNFAILSIKSRDPSIGELKEMLEYIYNIKEWDVPIIPSSNSSFLIEFPSTDLLKKAISSPFVDMGSFGGSFAKWSERKGLHVFTEPVFIWVQISSLSFHL